MILKYDYTLKCDYCNRKMFTIGYLEQGDELYIIQLCKFHRYNPPKKEIEK